MSTVWMFDSAYMKFTTVSYLKKVFKSIGTLFGVGIVNGSEITHKMVT